MALADSQKEERARLLEAFISSANNYRSTDGLMIIDRHGRAIYSNNVPGAQKRRLAEGIRHGTRNCRLPELTDSGFLDSVTTTLPQELRSCHVSPLKLNGDLRGAALLFPMTIERRSSISIVPGTAISQRLRDAASAIVGQSPALLSAVDVATRVAQSEQVTSLLIEGETGVGKELFARLVHLGGQGALQRPHSLRSTAARSPRSCSAANCSATSPEPLPAHRGKESRASSNWPMAAF
ncbi:sigma 54-interacting transcriptional regulator [Rhizobium sp. RCAM05973]|uniref:sigma 54-interacting transcriptional regulator n=1 Tax=Rhizobium sp. RCAM05973 TaxID=2994066 RepID=UPI0022EBFDEA|nr:sigma 54-interacting transcriptional regulator [Rhizobium sp. RCAM05973]